MRIKRKALHFVSTMLAPSVLAAQGLVVVPSGNLKEQHDAMNHAYAAWVKGDANLECEMFQLAPDEARERIQNATVQAGAYYRARQIYLATLITRLQEVIATLDSPTAKLGTPELNKAVDRKLQDLAAAGETPRKQAEVGAGEKDRRRVAVSVEAQEELRRLEELRKNLRDQSDLLNHATNAADLLDGARAELLTSHQALLRMLTDEQERAKTESSRWGDYYKSLSDLVSSQQSPSKKKDGQAATETR